MKMAEKVTEQQKKVRG